MHNVLLVDDEPRQLRAMATIIKSLRPHYALHTAADGEEALALINQFPIDVVMTDIRMPVMDGMELLKHLSTQNYQGKLVLITGYGDFNYAQQAIRLGIFDYIVKPIGKPDLEHLLDKLDQVLENEREENKKWTEITHKLEASINAYHHQLLLDWLQGNSDGSELREMLYPQIAEHKGLLLVMRNKKQEAEQGKERINNQLLIERVRGLFQQLSSLTIFIELDGKLVMLAAHHNHAIQNNLSIHSALEAIINDLRSEYDLVCTLGCVELNEENWKKGKTCYDQAAKALDRSFILGIGQVIPYQDCDDTKRSIDLFEQEQQFAAAIQKGNVEQLNKHINDLLEKVRDITYPKAMSIKEDGVRLIINRLKEAQHLASKDELSLLSDQFENKMMLCEDYRELRHAMKNAATSISELYRRTNEDKNHIVMQKCHMYIQEHFQEDISLEAIAQMFHFNASYFSTLFKSHTNMNLTDYIMSVRMDKAKQLLLHSKDKIADIAQKIGYKDVGYFIRVFKRENGISPKKFRSLTGKDQ
ncbi:response regulator [Paenibacillus sp. FSL H8-0537]|uniref:response regulator transcription factor n=1 Tax=Paenibacillus sp. FSL H8-0537 TaxID=2921399 RepID=UPI003100CA79